MFLIVGLGNVGKKYSNTRHNVGFEVVDLISNKLKLQWVPGKGEYYFAHANCNDKDIVLIKPTTFMNNSGIAVVHAMQEFDVPDSDLLVICDDFNLPLGKIRLRPKGSDGGHNGLYSIIYQTNSENFSRLRTGIGCEFEKSQVTSYVLSEFSKDEIPIVEDMINRAADAALFFVSDGLYTTMNKFN